MTDLPQRFDATYTIAANGYMTKADIDESDNRSPMRWHWKGDGEGAGVLHILGTGHYLAQILNAVQTHPILRYATEACAVDEGQLDLGIIADG